jgi:acyl-CoA thioesterase I
MKKRTGLIITALFIIAMIVMAHTNKKDTLPPIQGPIIAFGDSLVFGVGATKGNDFVSVLSRMVDRDIINAGMPGDSTVDLLNRLNSDIAVRDPGLVIVLVGGNDYLQHIPKEQTLENIRTIINQIQQTGAEVILIGVSRIVYNKEYKAIAESEGIEFVPHILDYAVMNRAQLMSDSVHPNDKGYKIFAENIAPTVQKLLNR